MTDAVEVPHVVAVDLGGTHMRCALVSPDGVVHDVDKRATDHAEPTPETLVEMICALAPQADQAVIGVPGRVDYGAGLLENAANLPRSWLPHLTEERLAARAGLPVLLANDADLAAVGEAFHGAGRGFDDVVYITVSTGIGGGALLGGRLVAGRHSLVEIGHTVIDWTARLAGKPSTAEELGSGTALARLAAARGLPGDGRAVLDLVRRGDPVAREVWESVADAIAIAVGNLAELFCPDVIVVGGGVGLNDDLLHPRVQAYLAERGPVGLTTPIELRRAALGDDAGLVGACSWRRATGRS